MLTGLSSIPHQPSSSSPEGGTTLDMKVMETVLDALPKLQTAADNSTPAVSMKKIKGDVKNGVKKEVQKEAKKAVPSAVLEVETVSETSEHHLCGLHTHIMGTLPTRDRIGLRDLEECSNSLCRIMQRAM